MAWMAAENQGGFGYGVLLVAALAYWAPLFFQTFRSQSLRQKEGSQHGFIAREAPLNTRYFTAAQIGVSFALPFCIVIPLTDEKCLQSGYSVILLFLLSLSGGIALIYANRKGDLNWLDQVESSNHEGQEP